MRRALTGPAPCRHHPGERLTRVVNQCDDARHKPLAFQSALCEILENFALQYGQPPLEVQSKRWQVGGSGRIIFKPARNHFYLPDFVVVGFKAPNLAEAKEAVERDHARQEVDNAAAQSGKR